MVPCPILSLWLQPMALWACLTLPPWLWPTLPMVYLMVQWLSLVQWPWPTLPLWL